MRLCAQQFFRAISIVNFGGCPCHSFHATWIYSNDFLNKLELGFLALKGANSVVSGLHDSTSQAKMLQAQCEQCPACASCEISPSMTYNGTWAPNTLEKQNNLTLLPHASKTKAQNSGNSFGTKWEIICHSMPWDTARWYSGSSLHNFSRESLPCPSVNNELGCFMCACQSRHTWFIWDPATVANFNSPVMGASLKGRRMKRHGQLYGSWSPGPKNYYIIKKTCVWQLRTSHWMTRPKICWSPWLHQRWYPPWAARCKFDGQPSRWSQQ